MSNDVCVLCVYGLAGSLCILVQGPYACVGVRVRKSLRVHICVCAGAQQKPSVAVFWNLLFPAAPCPWWGGINICFPSSLSLATANRAARQNVPPALTLLPPHTCTHTPFAVEQVTGRLWRSMSYLESDYRVRELAEDVLN